MDDSRRQDYVVVDAEREALLPTHIKHEDDDDQPLTKPPSPSSPITKRSFSVLHLTSAFAGGIIACVLAQFAICGHSCIPWSTTSNDPYTNTHNNAAVAPPYVGSTEVHNFPPTSPTNAFPSLFPTDVGYPGGTPTGAEPAVIATAPAYPLHTGAANLLIPESLGAKRPKKDFDLFKSWGNLSPWYSVGRGTFGVDSEPATPETCRVTGLHFLHRHGARYPTEWASYGGPAKLASRLNEAAEKWNATGNLDFLNEWTYKLGEELLTPFGRQQLYDLGISVRLKYGFLLKNFTESNTIPVFRTESQDRMLKSALNFAIGFFGYPFEDQYQQSITIEAGDFNNTLAPYMVCPNARRLSVSDRGTWYVKKWAAKYLASARERLQKGIDGFELSIEDVYTMQQMCAYETVAIGYSKFCEQFTQEEWEGFDYALDLAFWYNSAFGSPVARVQGAGWVQETLARLQKKPVTREDNKFSMNYTLDGDIRTFPVDQSLYVDATHEVVVLNIITALNLTSFAASGPLPYDHIPKNRTFKVSQLAPFATNVQFQLLDCTSHEGPQIRIIINDGVAPLSGIEGCPSADTPEGKNGVCPVETFVKAQKKLLSNVDWDWACHGDWEVGEGPEWETVTGDPPEKF